MRTLSAVSIVILFVVTGAAQVKYSTYENGRFGFSIDYPSTLLMQEPPPLNGDGRSFVSKDNEVKMYVWAHYNALFRSVQEEFDEELKIYGGTVSYKRKLKDGFAFSGIKDGKIFYQKTLYHKFKSTDVFFIFMIEYPTERRRTYDPIVERISHTFRFDPDFDV